VNPYVTSLEAAVILTVVGVLAFSTIPAIVRQWRQSWQLLKEISEEPQTPAPGEAPAAAKSPAPQVQPSPAPGFTTIIRNIQIIERGCHCTEFADHLQGRSRWTTCPEHTPADLDAELRKLLS